MTPIRELAIGAGDVAFRKTCDADRKLGMFANEPDQLAGKLETARRHFELAPSGRIAAQCQDILDTQRPNLAQQVLYLLLRRLDTRKMSDSGETVLPLNAIDDHQRLVAGAPAGTVSHRTIIRPGFEQRRDGLFEQ